MNNLSNKIINSSRNKFFFFRNFIKNNNDNGNIKYSPNHQWVKISDNKDFATIGITSYASDVVNNEFNKILKIKLPKINEKIGFNQPFLSISTNEDENIQFKSPLSGIVSKVNKKFHQNQQTTTISTTTTTTTTAKISTITTTTTTASPLKSNSLLFNDIQNAWTIELKINEPFQTNHLMNEEEYAHYCENIDYK
ncbi:hypothetical protein RB653_008273 [Dictyostelium firmibasis]|uniref:Glycine cleavage system H protein n=1 Tax=Dictyostelium firmibasis TaxID=79012 RepID=A0AAN7YTV9_9MYCE